MRGYAAIVGVFWQKRGFLPDRAPVGLSTQQAIQSSVGMGFIPARPSGHRDAQQEHARPTRVAAQCAFPELAGFIGRPSSGDRLID
jgi:hypothetical protein